MKKSILEMSKREKVLLLCNPFIDCTGIPESNLHQAVVNAIEVVYKQRIYDIDKSELEDILDSLDFGLDMEQIVSNYSKG